MLNQSEITWEIRPPWPDELPRLVTHFGLKEQRPGFLKSWIWCIVAGSEERIVGAVQLLEGDTGSKVSLIDFTIRSAWVEHPATKKAFRAALAKAQELNLTRVQTQTPLGGGMEKMLLELEFESDPPREIWQLSIESGKRTTMGIVDRLHKRYPRVIEPLSQSNLAAVTGLCEKLGLLSASRIAVGQPGQVSSTAFDPRLSFVIMEGEEAAAILLSRIIGHQIYIEVMAQSQQSAIAGQAAAATLLRSFFTAASDLKHEVAQCTIQPSLSPGLPTLMKRADGKCLSRFASFQHV